MSDLLQLDDQSEEQIVFVGEAARNAGVLACALESLGYATAHASSIADIDEERPPAAVVVAAEDGADPFASVRAIRMCGRLADALVFAWAPETLYRPVAVAVAAAAGADDVVGGRLGIDESVDRVATRLRSGRPKRRDVDPVSQRHVRDAIEVLAREREARRQLEAEKTVRERLLGMMTHELLTQANVAMGWLNLLRREHLDAVGRDRAFAKVAGALDAQLTLLDELVGMSPIAVGHVNVDCRRVDVSAVARAVAGDVGDERVRVVATEVAIVVADFEHVLRAIRALVDAATRDADFVHVRVGVSGDFVKVRLSLPIREDDAALGVARRVAVLYGGALTFADDETSFELPSKPPG